jgi:hypothetical protein
MRRFLVVLVLVCLVVRWADAGCGCAEHNGWGALIAEIVTPLGHEHGTDESAAEFTHGCQCDGRANDASWIRVRIADIPAIEFALVAAASFEPRPKTRSADRELSFGRGAPLRASLQVYRI